MLKEQINQLVAQAFEEVVNLRRHLHAHPELSFHEYETARFIQDTLKDWGISSQPMAGTGVLVVLKGTKGESATCIALRADIDALPIQEQSDLPFSSTKEGIMHACGHDFHTANLLGVCRILHDLKAEFAGTVLFLFQPAEEKIPGGALTVLADPVLIPYLDRIEAVLGLHVSPKIPSGKLAVCPGKFMASSDEFYIQIKGKGGHAAEPQLGIDPVMITAQLLTTLQQVVSRYADPKVPSVLSFGRVIANGAANVIPDEVSIAGTFRTVDEAWRQKALTRIEDTIQGIPAIFGAEVALEVRRGYPFLHNNEQLAERFITVVANAEGPDSIERTTLWMAAEDFAYYSQRFPSLFYLVGIYNEAKNCVSGLHTSTFRVDEDAFTIAMRSLLNGVFDLLAKDTVTI